MARFTAAEVQEKHARRLKAAVPDIISGVGKVTEAPGKKAAAKAAKMKANLNAKLDDGTWARRVAAVPVEDWKASMINKGAPRIAAGIDGAKDKSIAFYEQLLPAVDAAKAKIAAMPDVTIEDNINRVGTYLREMGKFSKK